MSPSELRRIAAVESGLRALKNHVLDGHRREQIAKALMISAGELRRVREGSTCQGSGTSSKN